MKILRRSRMSGSRTPWEQLCDGGFNRDPRGFVLVIDREGRLVIASLRWRERFGEWWRWNEGARWREVAPERGARAAWRAWSRVLRGVLESESALQDSTTLRRGRRESVRLGWVSQPLRDAAGQRVGVVVAGKFSEDVLLPEKVTLEDEGDAGGSRVPASATVWVRAKRRRGETGFFVERVSAGAKRVLGGAPLLRVGADFPECLPLTLRADSAAALARSGRTVRAVFPLVVEKKPAKAEDVQLTLLAGAGDRHCVLLQRGGSGRSARDLLVTCGEQLVSLEGELRRAQRLATQGMLAAMMNHEINNCLGIALANTTLFYERHGDNRDAAHAIKPVIHALQAAGGICRQFQNLGGRNGTGPEMVDLAAIVQRSFEMLVRIVPRRITFERSSADPLQVRADPTHIEQIVVNLVLNARDATRESTGQISLSAGRTEGLRSARHWLEVRDNGVGIPPEDQQRLFTAFFTTKPTRRGTGLGLATVLRLTKAIGGEVQLTSKVGEGTCVRVVLPEADGVSHVERPRR